MSIQRYQRSAPLDSNLADYVPSGATVDGSGAQFVDVDLADDAELADLSEYMDSIGFQFVETSPASPVTSTTASPFGYVSDFLLSYTDAHTVTAGGGIVRDDGGAFDIISMGNLTADIEVSGAGGLDTGAEAADTWYAVWVIGDTTGVNAPALLLSESFNAPTLPPGYDVQRRIGAVRNDAASNFIAFDQRGSGRTRRYFIDGRINVLAGGNQTGTFAAVDFSSAVPPSSRRAQIAASLAVGIGPATSVAEFALPGRSPQAFVGPGIVITQPLTTLADVPLDSNQTTTYRVSDVANTLDIDVLAYDDDL